MWFVWSSALFFHYFFTASLHFIAVYVTLRCFFSRARLAFKKKDKNNKRSNSATEQITFVAVHFDTHCDELSEEKKVHSIWRSCWPFVGIISHSVWGQQANMKYRIKCWQRDSWTIIEQRAFLIFIFINFSAFIIRSSIVFSFFFFSFKKIISDR